MNIFLYIKRWGLLGAVCISACAMSGCIESTFDLATESRMPLGIAVPPGLSRDDVTLTLDFHTLGNDKLTLRDKKGKKLATFQGKTKGNVIYLKSTPKRSHRGDPGYELVVINGQTEILECTGYTDLGNNFMQKSLFYVVDDPAVKEKVLASRRVK